ncbi:MAG: hypothetical protein IPJ89_03985 [Candidatus Iainarchaeum archaeon]|uniref:Yip1 domain-containing protein n=1 Tax=Candidatus Iainarchaeum sp. TaxID=3101447 RepID=A0A7T9DJ43_9ARCH|nr:MAG: hypothetical protein IPJ89_03985 [Candidatus Diapherotrites archaeon]
MSYYSDLILRPKQAVMHAFEQPSAVRAFGLVILATLFATLMMLVLVGQLDVQVLLVNLLGDVVRLVSGGLLLFVLGVVFKRIQANSHTFVQALSMLASLSFYSFLMLVLIGFIFPFVLAPQLPASFQELQDGTIGPQEFEAAIGETLAGISDLAIFITLIFFLLFVVLVLYSVYALYLSVSIYLKTTVFWSIIVMLLYSFIVSSLTGFFAALVGA